MSLEVSDQISNLRGSGLSANPNEMMKRSIHAAAAAATTTTTITITTTTPNDNNNNNNSNNNNKYNI